MRFKKRPIEIEAEQWFPGTPVEGVTEVRQAHDDQEIYETGGTVRGMIVTRAGPIYASPGDWIVTGIEGDKYSVKPEVFEKLYEPV